MKKFLLLVGLMAVLTAGVDAQNCMGTGSGWNSLSGNNAVCGKFFSRGGQSKFANKVLIAPLDTNRVWLNDTSAALQINSTNTGFLTSRVTTAQMLAIPSPANGLFVYNTDSNKFYYRANLTWVQVGSGSGGGSYTFTNGLTESGGTAKWGGAMTENTEVTYDQSVYGLVFGDFNKTSLSGNGILSGLTPYGTFNILSSTNRNLIQGALTANTSPLLSPSANFGRIVNDSLQQDVTVRIKDTIEIGLANIGNSPDGSVYSNIFNAIIYRPNPFAPPTYYADIQRAVTRYYPDNGKRERSFIEFITSQDLHKTAPFNGFFANKDKAQLNIGQGSDEYRGGDTATAKTAFEFTATNGFSIYTEGANLKARIDTSGILTIPLNAGVGKILTSDPSGNGTWQEPLNCITIDATNYNVTAPCAFSGQSVAPNAGTGEGLSNTFLGVYSGATTTGSGNTGIGSGAGNTTTGNNNTFVGAATAALYTDANNVIALGFQATADTSNQFAISDSIENIKMNGLGGNSGDVLGKRPDGYWGAVSVGGVNVVDGSGTITPTATGYYSTTATLTSTTLPNVAATVGQRYVVINMGSGAWTFNSNAGGNDIWQNGVTTNIFVAGAGETYIMYNNGVYWTILN